jgi:hypothetical protein
MLGKLSKITPEKFSAIKLLAKDMDTGGLHFEYFRDGTKMKSIKVTFRRDDVMFHFYNEGISNKLAIEYGALETFPYETLEKYLNFYFG